MVVAGGLWSFALGLWLFAGGLGLFPGGLWSFASGLFSLPVLLTANTCYINSILQSLSTMIPFWSGLTG